MEHKVQSTATCPKYKKLLSHVFCVGISISEVYN